jgi:hypothetical protein
MRQLPRGPAIAHVGAALLTALLASGCADANRTTEPRLATQASSLALASGGAGALVNMMDACDRATFDVALGDPNACLRTEGVTFAEFIAELQRSGAAGAWHFAPPTMDAMAGATLDAVNRGGEMHTFTRVAAFGGGIVPSLNALSHNPVPAPECTMLEADDFVAPGGSYQAMVGSGDTELYQCCIHPWMRTVVHVHRG